MWANMLFLKNCLECGITLLPKRKWRFQEPGAFPRHFLSEDTMRELSIFADEAGLQDMSEGYYL